MIITRTPLRISFFGGGTDYPQYFRQHGGETLITAIDKSVFVTVHPLADLFDHKLQVHYSRVESVRSLDEIQITVVRETLRHLGVDRGVEIHLVGDLPARTGLGTSSATTVGLLNALHGHRGLIASATQLAEEAVHIEQEVLGELVGSQDQYSAALGGFRHLKFGIDGKVTADPVILPPGRLQDLENSLLLFYSGVQRNAAVVLEEQIQKTSAGKLDEQLSRMRQQVGEGLSILCSGAPLADFGLLLHEAWQSKRTLSSQVSNRWIDEIYERARNAGALGGKLLGAGGGGFLLLYVEPDQTQSVRSALVDLHEVRFQFESSGSRTIFYTPDSPS